MSAEPAAEPSRLQRPRGKLGVYVPLMLFAVLAVFAFMRLISGADNAVVPSALIGKPVPVAPLGVLGDLPAFNPEVTGRVTVVNVWASWCAPCRQEHPLLVELGKDQRFDIAGINYKDQADNALGFLSELGNPYDRIGTDGNGRAAIEWGVYGVPETFIISHDGKIAYKHIGPLQPDDLTGAFGEALEAAVKAAPAS
jgi:cytochrome c biogenesis protein CcmG, thiol:disulfide interchange protein DsbE